MVGKRMVVAIENKPYTDGRMFEVGVVQTDKDKIPVSYSVTEVVGWASDLQREETSDGVYVSMQITFFDKRFLEEHLTELIAFAFLSNIEVSKAGVVTKGDLSAVSVALDPTFPRR